MFKFPLQDRRVQGLISVVKLLLALDKEIMQPPALGGIAGM